MDGIPYWGKETFKDMRKMEKKEGREKQIEEMGVGDMYGLFFELSKRNAIIRVQDDGRYYYAYARDIIWDYRDRVIILPYWRYKEVAMEYNTKDKRHLDYDGTTVVLRYEYEKNIYVIDNRQTHERVDSIEVYDKIKGELYKINISNLPYLSEEKGLFSMQGLYERYKEYGYLSGEWEKGNRYHMINSEKGNNKEYKIRSASGYKHKLKTTDYTRLLQYKDIKMYIDETEGERSKRAYWERRYRFESYLYCIFGENLQPEEEEEKRNFKRLGEVRVYKYGERGNSLFLKYYYKDGVGKRKKTYEKYIPVKWIGIRKKGEEKCIE